MPKPKAKPAPAALLFDDLYPDPEPPKPPDPAVEEPQPDAKPEAPPALAPSPDELFRQEYGFGPSAAPEPEPLPEPLPPVLAPPAPREPAAPALLEAAAAEVPAAAAAAPEPAPALPAEPAAAAPEGFALFGRNLFGDEIKPPASGPLSERFTMPPFTVFDARQGQWQDRKRAWVALGIQSELGRGDNLLNLSPHVQFQHATGIKFEQAREIVAKAQAEQGEAFDLAALIEQYGRRSAAKNLGGETFGSGRPGDLQAGFKAKEQAATAISQRLAPGGGGGGAWIGGPRTASTERFERKDLDRRHGFGLTADAFRAEGEPVTGAAATGTSIFDPVLCELLYRWFCPPGGAVLDPFAGGSVRGIVASKLKLAYTGIELRGEQIAANLQQAETICAGDPQLPRWLEGDARNCRELCGAARFDFLLACPPYYDLEQYSDDPRDLSNMSWPAFRTGYATIIERALELLKPDRFACFVVGDVRDEEGLYRGLPELTVGCFKHAKAAKYNEAILVTSVGSLPVRVGRQFNAARKLGKTHQNVLCFVKGDPKRAAEACNGQLDLPVAEDE